MLSTYWERGNLLHPKDFFLGLKYPIKFSKHTLSIVSKPVNKHLPSKHWVRIRPVLCGKAVTSTDKSPSSSSREDKCYANWGHGEREVSIAYQYKECAGIITWFEFPTTCWSWDLEQVGWEENLPCKDSIVQWELLNNYKWLTVSAKENKDVLLYVLRVYSERDLIDWESRKAVLGNHI